MRIAISSPIRWAIGLAAVVTIALVATRSPAPAHDGGSKPVKRMHAAASVQPARAELSQLERTRADRIELAAIERDLDAMTDRLEVAAQAEVDAPNNRERAVAHAALTQLERDIHDRAQIEQDRSDVLRSRLGE